MLHLGTLLKLTIVPYFQAMFPIYSSAIKYLCAKYTILYIFYIGEKRLGGHPSSEETRDPPPLEEGEIPPTQEQEEEDMVEIVTTTGDRDVVGRDPFTSESAQILIGEIMGCNLELENLKKNINDVIQKNKNIIDVLGRVKNPSKSLSSFVCYKVLNVFVIFLKAKFGGCTQYVNMCYLPSREINGRILGVQPLPQ
ncbi:hypothetical protein AB205_0040130 [Aquarana catesbeiana]|uniref:Uncharacterized protein n=1 Tax=Aquarana catesbeiana TaxID=8400 RepID=A0A2G9Q5X2_AQUCT|nr:hypothetical protein AB205_0040130 [Aquarana catesbeiana]